MWKGHESTHLTRNGQDGEKCLDRASNFLGAVHLSLHHLNYGVISATGA